MNKMKWYELAEQRRKVLGLSQTELADEFDVTQATVGNWLNNRREPGIDLIAKILDRLGVREVVLYPDGTVSQDESILSKPTIKLKGTIEFRSQPMGELKPSSEEYLHYYSNDFKAYAMQVDGSFLEPRIVSGEIIVVEPSVECQNYDEVLINKKDGGYLICLLLVGRNNDNRYLNPNTMQEYKDLVITEDDEMHYIAGIVKKNRLVK